MTRCCACPQFGALIKAASLRESQSQFVIQVRQGLSPPDIDDVFNKCSSQDGAFGMFRSHRDDSMHTLSFVQFLEALRQLATLFLRPRAWPQGGPCAGVSVLSHLGLTSAQSMQARKASAD